MYAIANKSVSTVFNSDYSSSLKQSVTVNLGGDLGTFLIVSGRRGQGNWFCFLFYCSCKEWRPYGAGSSSVLTDYKNNRPYTCIYKTTQPFTDIECVALRIRVKADILEYYLFPFVGTSEPSGIRGKSVSDCSTKSRARLHFYHFTC